MASHYDFPIDFKVYAHLQPSEIELIYLRQNQIDLVRISKKKGFSS